jgi:uncharacterized membrane protein YgaE (UPF0421/DUF939 family)
MLLGAILGVVFCATAASAPVVYGVTLAVGTIYCLVEDRFLEPRDRLRRRTRER